MVVHKYQPVLSCTKRCNNGKSRSVRVRVNEFIVRTTSELFDIILIKFLSIWRIAVECGRIGTTRLVDKIPPDSSELFVIREITIDKTIARFQGIDYMVCVLFYGRRRVEDQWRVYFYIYVKCYVFYVQISKIHETGKTILTDSFKFLTRKTITKLLSNYLLG